MISTTLKILNIRPKKLYIATLLLVISVMIGARGMTCVNIIGLKDPTDRFIFNPTPDTELEEGDVMIVLGTENEISTFMMYCSGSSKNILGEFDFLGN